MKRTPYFLLIGILFLSVMKSAAHQPAFSTAGFYQLQNTGRSVYSMNVAWRFHKGEVAGAEAPELKDSLWQVVSLPHGIEYLPTEASGSINYQGPVWYRKHFRPADSLQGKKLFLHFEAIMGKSKVWINGHLLTEHFGGYLPVICDISAYVRWGADNVIAVWADNSDDPTYPPGKQQKVLDFAYFGGIYRDCWLIAHNKVFITDPNYEDEVAGGGLLVAYDHVSDKQAEISLKIHVRNQTKSAFSGRVTYQLKKQDGTLAATTQHAVRIRGGQAGSFTDKIILHSPELWAPESPYLYNLLVTVQDKAGKVIDGYRKRIGVRSIAFKGQDGLWLNGKPYEKPLIGANRHQDFAVVGNALPNSIHWCDAKKLRDVGLKIIRNAHYPQDPAFMDACDELGLFVIVTTPGWQFWNKNPVFEQRVYSDIRNMVRRDRNHPSVFLWEPILNETWYPDYFAKNVHDLVAQEFPYPSSYSACDARAKGKEYFPVLYSHPTTGDAGWALKNPDPTKTYFTREWGDNVDDWRAHNSPSRVNRAWGEVPMLIQAQHYAKPDYKYTSYDALFRTTRQHIGGCLWHSFDHQRGYHPDPFYGGLMDVFRQPKYSYYMFMAQRDPQKSSLIAETGPMVYIANQMTPFSPTDVTVYSNCDEVRLTVFKNGKQYVYKKEPGYAGMPSPVITFKNAWDFMADKALSRDKRQDEVYLLAEGLMNGKVVATHKVSPARRPEKLLLWLDHEGVSLCANGNDIATVVAAIADKNGNIKRLNNYFIKFSVSGEGRLLGNAAVMANPRPVIWGTAPVLIQSTTRPGTIKIKASVLYKGINTPTDATLEIETTPTAIPLVIDTAEAKQLDRQIVHVTTREQSMEILRQQNEKLKKEINSLKLRETERQQEEFGEQH